MACAVVEMARCCVPRRAWRPRRQQRRVTRRRGQHGPSSHEERLLYRPRSVKGQAPAATHINLRASDHPAAPGHGCDATMAPGAAFEFGGGSPGSILPLQRQRWCAAAPRPHFPCPIRPEPPSSPPSSALTEPCMPLSGTANGAGTAADGTEGTVRTPGIAAAAAAVTAALSGRDAAAFSSFLRVLNLQPAAAREAPARVRPLGGPGGGSSYSLICVRWRATGVAVLPQSAMRPRRALSPRSVSSASTTPWSTPEWSLSPPRGPRWGTIAAVLSTRHVLGLLRRERRSSAERRAVSALRRTLLL